MSFCWEMMQEEEENEAGQEMEERETNAVAEDNVCEETEANAEEKDLLVIQMTNTSISLLRGRGCDTENSCEGCHGNQCAVNDIVVVAESSMVTLGESVHCYSPVLTPCSFLVFSSFTNSNNESTFTFHTIC